MTQQMTDVDKRVRDTLVRTFNLSMEQSIGDVRLGGCPQWDSMGHMQLIMELESEFNLTFPTYLMAELVSVDAIVLAIQAEEER
jgi:acyl carrier protein